MRSALYEGRVRHRRFAPAEHAFDYTLFMLYLDLSELGEVFRGRWLWSATRPAPARFRREDHYGDPAVPLDAAIRELVVARGARRPEGPIGLLTHLAYFGHCFNPVSFYYCWDRDGREVETVVAEVANTPWHERHMYVLDRRSSTGGGDVMSFRGRKEFHVSPFMSMDQEYAWALRAPGERLTVHMENHERGAKLFDATMNLERRALTGRSLARALAGWPLMTLKVVGAIHWEAFKLWAKDVPVFTHPGRRGEESA